MTPGKRKVVTLADGLNDQGPGPDSFLAGASAPERLTGIDEALPAWEVTPKPADHWGVADLRQSGVPVGSRELP
jgi:hypothetical protein